MSQFTCSNYQMSCLCGLTGWRTKVARHRGSRSRRGEWTRDRKLKGRKKRNIAYNLPFSHPIANPIPKRALRLLRLWQAWCNNDTLQLQLQQNGSNFAQTKGMGKLRPERKRLRGGGRDTHTLAHTHTVHWWTRISITVCLTVCTCGLSNVRNSWAK